MKKFNLHILWCIFFFAIHIHLSYGQHQCNSSLSISLGPNDTYTLFPEDLLGEEEFQGYEKTITPSEFTCANLGNNIVVANVYQNGSLEFTCTSTVFVTDVNNPIANCKSSLNVELNSEGIHHFTFEEIDNGSSDGCGNFQFLITPQQVNCSSPNPVHVVLLIIDESGNSNSSSLDVSWDEYSTPVTSLACNALTLITIIPGQEIEITSDMVLEGGPYGCPSRYTVEISENGNARPEPIVTVDDTTKQLEVQVTDTQNGNLCWGLITVITNPECNVPFHICDTECRLAAAGDCNSGHTSLDNIEWPCDIVLQGNCQYVLLEFSPTFLVSEGLAEEADASPQLVNAECYLISTAYTDQVIDNISTKEIIRTWNILSWISGEIWSYVQHITVQIDVLSICDTQAWDTPYSDCAGGHSATDDVEWPADITVHSIFTHPEDLAANSDVAPENVEPRIFTECTTVDKVYNDFVTQVNDTVLNILRTWTVKEFNTAITYTYQQTITAIFDLSVREVCVTRENGEGIPDVELIPGFTTGENGCYTFDNPVGVIVTPVKDSPLLEGVNFLDKILLLEYLLGIRQLTPLQMRAGDLNESGSLTYIDVVLMDKLLAGTLIPSFEHNWKFFEQSTLNSFADITDSAVPYKFIGIKMGDIDNSFPLSATAPLEHVALKINDEILNKKETYNIPFFLEKNTRILGFSTQIKNINQHLNVLNVNAPNLPGFTMEANVTFTTDLITIHWIAPGDYLEQGVALSSENPLFTFTLKPTVNSILSEEMELETSYENLVKPSGNKPALDLNVDFQNVIISSVLQLDNGQKINFYPNPVRNEIHFTGIDPYDNGKVSIHDATGRKVYESNLTEKLDLSPLPAGLFYIHVVTQSGISSATPLYKL